MQVVRKKAFFFLFQPFNILTISIVVVEDGHAGLSVTMQLGLLSVVRLRHSQSSSVAPVVEPVAGVGGGHGHLVGGPEPAVDVLGEQVWSITSIKVAEAARSPEIWHIGCKIYS